MEVLRSVQGVSPILRPRFIPQGIETVRMTQAGLGTFWVEYSGPGKRIGVGVGGYNPPIVTAETGGEQRQVTVRGHAGVLQTPSRARPSEAVQMWWKESGSWQPSPADPPRDSFIYFVFAGGLDPDVVLQFANSLEEVVRPSEHLPPSPAATKAATPAPDSKTQGTATPEQRLWVTPTSDTDKQKISIAEQLFTNYLNGYRSLNTPEENRLLDFRIESVRLYRPISTPYEPAKIYASVVFSVLPAIHIPNRNPWLVGNGTVGEDGWVVGKGQFLTIVQTKDGYTIEYRATAP